MRIKAGIEDLDRIRKKVIAKYEYVEGLVAGKTTPKIKSYYNERHRDVVIYADGYSDPDIHERMSVLLQRIS